LLTHPAGAEPARAEASDAAVRVDFEAGRVESHADAKELVLSDDVLLSAGRYRLTSDRLVLCRVPGGADLRGRGVVRFCPCESAPLKVGFSGASLRDGDLTIQNPTLRVYDVPLLWLPYLRLRPSDEPGLLPPRLAWRGPDGLLAGSGIHLPLGKPRSTAALDLRISGYVEGGFELESRLATQRSSTALRWDHLRQSLLAVDAHGASSEQSGWTGAYRVDALRGPRALAATSSLEQVARRYDHALFGVSHVSRALQFGLGGRALAQRGGAFDDYGAVGPFAALALGEALGSSASISNELGVSTASDRTLGTETRALQRAELRAGAVAGPLGFDLALHENIEARLPEDTADAARAATDLGISLEAGWPLQRDYGPDPDPLQHRVEPFTRAALALDWDELGRDEPADTIAWLGGVRSALGRYARRDAGTLSLQGGALGRAQQLATAFAGQAVLDADWLGLSAEAAGFARRASARLAALRSRVGNQSGVHLSSYFEGRTARDSGLLRLLFEDYWDAPETGWFDRAGWSGGTGVHVPWTRWLASSLGADYDFEAAAVLGVRGALSYRHPCGCLAAIAWAGQRIGRDGVDVAFTLDLMP